MFIYLSKKVREHKNHVSKSQLSYNGKDQVAKEIYVAI